LAQICPVFHFAVEWLAQMDFCFAEELLYPCPPNPKRLRFVRHTGRHASFVVPLVAVLSLPAAAFAALVM